MAKKNGAGYWLSVGGGFLLVIPFVVAAVAIVAFASGNVGGGGFLVAVAVVSLVIAYFRWATNKYGEDPDSPLNKPRNPW